MNTLRPLRDAAITAVSAQLTARAVGSLSSAGPVSCSPDRQQMEQHLDHLEGALLTGHADLFIDYAIWLKGVLSRRQAPFCQLADSFDLLEEFLAARMLAEEVRPVSAILQAARAALHREDRPLAPPPSHLPALPQTEHYCASAMGGHQAEAQGVFCAVMQQGFTLTETSVRLVQPAMIEVGRLWQDNRITIAREHLATAVSQNVLARAYVEAEFAAPVGRRALFAGVEGNQHSLGLRMLSDAFETIGWEADYLGGDLPIADLMRQVDAVRPDLICLSAALSGHLVAAREATESLRAEFGSRCPTIWVGGQATLTTERAWRAVQADGWAADALHALEQAR